MRDPLFFAAIAVLTMACSVDRHRSSLASTDATASNPITYSASSQAELTALLEGLGSWKRDFFHESVDVEPNQQGESSGLTVDLRPYLPTRMTELLDLPKDQYWSGPNCYNSVAYVQNQSFRRYQGAFKFYRDAFCMKLPSDQQPQVGDIGDIESVYDDNKTLGKEVHAFIYLNDNVSFTKNGPDATEPYKLASVKSIEQFYSVLDACRSLKTDNEKIACHSYLDFYHCTPDAPFAEQQGEDGDRLYQLGKKLNAAKNDLLAKGIQGAALDLTDGRVFLPKAQIEDLLYTYYEAAYYFLSQPESQRDAYKLDVLLDLSQEREDLIPSSLYPSATSLFQNGMLQSCLFDAGRMIYDAYARLVDPRNDQTAQPFEPRSCPIGKFPRRGVGPVSQPN